VISESYARKICEWGDKLPRDCRDAADAILLAAARAGADLTALVELAAEIYARSLPESEDDPEPAFEDRQVRVETTFAGAGVITGDLTPECAAVVTAVLESLSAPMGAEDTRTREQRYHDGLQEAIRYRRNCIVIRATSGWPPSWAYRFTAPLAAPGGRAGLFEGAGRLGGLPYHAGRIVLPGWDQRVAAAFPAGPVRGRAIGHYPLGATCQQNIHSGAAPRTGPYAASAARAADAAWRTIAFLGRVGISCRGRVISVIARPAWAVPGKEQWSMAAYPAAW
jgi:hypothetical protein